MKKIIVLSIMILLLSCAKKGVAPETDKKKDLTPLSFSDLRYSYSVKYIDLDGNKLAYIDDGKGQPILFIHGLISNLGSFQSIYPVLIKNGYRVIGIDLLGYGKSSKPDMNYTIPFHAKTVISLIKKLKLKNVILLGQSMGGFLSMYITLKSQKIVKKLILFTPGGLIEIPEYLLKNSKKNYEKIFGFYLNDIKAFEKFLRLLVFKWSKKMDDALYSFKRYMLHPDWQKLKRTVKGTALSIFDVNNEIANNFQKIKIPTLVILGKKDRLVPYFVVSENIKEKTTTWRITVLDKCGHLLQYEKKEELIQAILKFLK